MNTRTLISLACAVFFLTAVQSSSADIKDTVDKSFKVVNGGTLTVVSDFGGIEVKTSSGNRVDIEIERKVRTNRKSKAKDILADLDIDISKSGDNVRIKTTYDRKRWGRNPLSLKYTITVPEQYNVDLKTAGGGISVEDLEGDVLVRTAGGGICLNNIDGEVRAKTSGGGIVIGDVKGDVDVVTSGGGITLGRIEGSVDARTSGGGIRIDEIGGYVRANTSGGSIHATLAGQPQNECKLTTSGGNIDVYLDGDVSLDLDARTSGGRVKTDIPVTVSGTIKKTSLNASINGGGPKMFLRTSGGSIHLREM